MQPALKRLPGDKLALRLLTAGLFVSIVALVYVGMHYGPFWLIYLSMPFLLGLVILANYAWPPTEPEDQPPQ